MKRLHLPAAVCALAVMLAGCGGPEESLAPPPPPADGGDAASVQVGPLLVRPASAAGFVAEEIPSWGPITFAALYGSEIRWLSSQALLDRIVYASGPPGNLNLYICNLDGSNRVRLTNTTADDAAPAWSPDGTTIVFDRQRPAQDREICMIGADGSDPHALTVNTVTDSHPTWSPDGRRIAFQTNRDGNNEIYVMYTDGLGAVNLTNHPASDLWPDWSPDASDPKIAFTSNRDGNEEIYSMHEDGSSPTRLTNNGVSDETPAIDPWGYRVAYSSSVQGKWDIKIRYLSGGGNAYVFSAGSSHDVLPAWSSDRRFICYSSDSDGDPELVVQQVDPPYERWQITHTGGTTWDVCADLGSPTMQTDRVIIGPAGSDWGGTNPVWSNAYGAITAYDDDGYRNLVRIGVRPQHAATLEIQAMTGPGSIGPSELVAVLVEAAEIVNLREDGGRMRPPVLWQFDSLDATAVMLYLHSETGKLVAALVLRDQAYPSGTGAPAEAVTQRMEGDGMLVEGSFAAVFDATGTRIADDASTIRISDSTVSIIR